MLMDCKTSFKTERVRGWWLQMIEYTVGTVLHTGACILSLTCSPLIHLGQAENEVRVIQ